MEFGVIWTKTIVDEFIREAMLNEEEQRLLRMKAAGWSRTKQAQSLNVSTQTLDRMCNKLKVKYDAAQKTSAILPRRQCQKKKSDKNVRICCEECDYYVSDR